MHDIVLQLLCLGVEIVHLPKFKFHIPILLHNIEDL